MTQTEMKTRLMLQNQGLFPGVEYSPGYLEEMGVDAATLNEVYGDNVRPVFDSAGNLIRVDVVTPTLSGAPSAPGSNSNSSSNSNDDDDNDRGSGNTFNPGAAGSGTQAGGTGTGGTNSGGGSTTSNPGPAGGPQPGSGSSSTSNPGPAGGPQPSTGNSNNVIPGGNGHDEGRRPIIMDLDGDGVEVSLPAFVQFDMDDDGFLERTQGWAGPDDGFLVIDLNADGSRRKGDGKIDQTKELVLSEWGNKGDTGLQALARAFDETGDGVPDRMERGTWGRLRVWQGPDQGWVGGRWRRGRAVRLGKVRARSIGLRSGQQGRIAPPAASRRESASGGQPSISQVHGA